jgi:ectoine hydroxylase-related dioxygenase (phytanoyl-CoA dioxygenase family)
VKLTSGELESGVLSDGNLESARMHLLVRGYVVLEGVLDREELEGIRARFTELLEEHANRTDPSRGASRYGMPLPFTPPFATTTVVANPLVLGLVRSVLGDDVVCSFFASDTPLPGSDYQHAHSDSKPLFPEKDVTVPPFGYVVNVPLVDFRVDNGPLEIWPYGTHMIADTALIPVAEFHDIEAQRESAVGRFSEELGPRPLLAEAGSIIVRDIRMWHRGTPNRSTEPRPMMSMVYNRPWYHHGTVEIDEQLFGELPDQVRTLFRTAVLR